MIPTDTTTHAGSQLKSELARYCLPSARRDANRKLAWVNSICLLFLLIGVIGSKRGVIRIKNPAPLEEPIPVIVEPPPPPPEVTKIEAQQNPEPSEKAEAAPPVVVATIDSPAINFSIPTVANMVVPNGIAVAPPGDPLKSIAPIRNGPVSISNTGTGGDRPAPFVYPELARQMNQQGRVLLSMTVDASGNITEIHVKQSSGFQVLDHAALQFVKRHWTLPSGTAGRVFEAPIRYTLAQ